MTKDQAPAISIRQPWAELILCGRKTVEIRSWSTEYRGPLWIHTGLKGSPELERAFGFSGLFKGGYVGRVVLSAIVPLDRNRWETWKMKHCDPGNYKPGLYAWILSSPHRLRSPIPSTGRLGLFYPSIDLSA